MESKEQFVAEIIKRINAFPLDGARLTAKTVKSCKSKTTIRVAEMVGDSQMVLPFGTATVSVPNYSKWVDFDIPHYVAYTEDRAKGLAECAARFYLLAKEIGALRTEED